MIVVLAEATTDTGLPVPAAPCLDALAKPVDNQALVGTEVAAVANVEVVLLVVAVSAMVARAATDGLGRHRRSWMLRWTTTLTAMVVRLPLLRPTVDRLGLSRMTLT